VFESPVTAGDSLRRVSSNLRNPSDQCMGDATGGLKIGTYHMVKCPARRMVYIFG